MSATAVPSAPRTRTEAATRTEKGASLSRGPAHLLGTALLVAGLYCLCKAHAFPAFSQLPNGHPVSDTVFFGIFRANGWTGMLTAIAGGLLLFGAAEHVLAKTVSLVVGVGLGIAAVMALISGNVLGMAAANHWTELVWGAAAAILLLNSATPRRSRTVVAERTIVDDRPMVSARPVADDRPAVSTRPVANDRPPAPTAGSAVSPDAPEFE